MLRYKIVFFDITGHLLVSLLYCCYKLVTDISVRTSVFFRHSITRHALYVATGKVIIQTNHGVI